MQSIYHKNLKYPATKYTILLQLDNKFTGKPENTGELSKFLLNPKHYEEKRLMMPGAAEKLTFLTGTLQGRFLRI